MCQAHLFCGDELERIDTPGKFRLSVPEKAQKFNKTTKFGPAWR
jgi:hypothetical protein